MVFEGAEAFDEQRLVEAVRAGDDSAFEILYRLYRSELVAHAARLLRSRAAAADLVQDVFLDLWRMRATWIVRTSVRGYLFGAVRRRAVGIGRRLASETAWREGLPEDLRDRHEPEPLADRADTDALADHVAWNGGDAAVLEPELAVLLERFVEELPEPARTVYRLGREGLTHEEIAEVAGITPNRVRQHRIAAADALVDRLAQAGWHNVLRRRRRGLRSGAANPSSRQGHVSRSRPSVFDEEGVDHE